MFRAISFTAFGVFLALTTTFAQDAKKDPPKKIPPQVEELLKLTPEAAIKRFDKDGDGKLSKDELPAVLGKAFDATDKNGDGKLDRAGVEKLQTLLRNVFAAGNQPKMALEMSRKSSTACSSNSTPTATARSHARPRCPSSPTTSIALMRVGRLPRPQGAARLCRGRIQAVERGWAQGGLRRAAVRFRRHRQERRRPIDEEGEVERRRSMHALPRSTPTRAAKSTAANSRPSWNARPRK